MISQLSLDRKASIVSLIKGAQSPLGRTAVMKLVFFLQKLRAVPLMYNFRIYTYGPYDAEVLEDLRFIELSNGVVSKKVQYANGTGVQLAIGSDAENIIDRSGPFIEKYHKDLNWVICNFGTKTASDLELLSTIIFLDRTSLLEGSRLIEEIHAIKPHHNKLSIRHNVAYLGEKGLLINSNHR